MALRTAETPSPATLVASSWESREAAAAIWRARPAELSRGRRYTHAQVSHAIQQTVSRKQVCRRPGCNNPGYARQSRSPTARRSGLSGRKRVATPFRSARVARPRARTFSSAAASREPPNPRSWSSGSMAIQYRSSVPSVIGAGPKHAYLRTARGASSSASTKVRCPLASPLASHSSTSSLVTSIAGSVKFPARATILWTALRSTRASALARRRGIVAYTAGLRGRF